MNIGYYAGDKHFLKHAIVLNHSIKETISQSSQTILVKDKDYDYFKSHLPNDINIITLKLESSLPFIDKVYAAALYESTIKDSFLWLDIDSYFLKPFSISNEYVMVNPVDMKNIGVNYGEATDDLWSEICSDLGLDLNRFNSVLTGISQEEIYPYYNIGFVSTHANYRLFNQTKDYIQGFIKDKMHFLDNPIKQIFIHHAIFTCIILSQVSQDKIKTLPEGVNYPLHLHEKAKDFDLSKLISFRYDMIFNDEVSLNLPKYLLDHKDQLTMKWIY